MKSETVIEQFDAKISGLWRERNKLINEAKIETP